MKPLAGADRSFSTSSPSRYLRAFSKLVCFSTLFLIFVGGMVTSTGSGLAVPDWPLSYGMLFPPMVGGVFYEHGHRMAAATVGFLVLCLAFWLQRKEKRPWIKKLGWTALVLVILQGVLGGITVKFFLPTPVSVAHGIVAQTFFILTIVLAYSQSIERQRREEQDHPTATVFIKSAFFFSFLIYGQLILGAIMRHTDSGLAIYDFPTMGGAWRPFFDETMLSRINLWRFDHDLEPVTMAQVWIHFYHRLTAAVIVIFLAVLNYTAWKSALNPQRRSTLYLLDVLVLIQIVLGIVTVLSGKQPIITSLHVVTGASILGVCVVLMLRVCPLSFSKSLTRVFS